MKVSLVTIFLLISTIVCAQSLKPNVGDSFSYEYVKINNLSNLSGKLNTTIYKIINFKILSVNNNGIEIKVSQPRIVSNQIYNTLTDTSLPLDSQEQTYPGIVNKILSEVSFNIIVDGKGNLTSVQNLNNIKTESINLAKKMNLDEENGPHAMWEKTLFSSNFFREETLTIFQRPKTSGNRNTSFIKMRSKKLKNGQQQEITDSISVKNLSQIDNNTGLTVSYEGDSIIRSYNLSGNIIEELDIKIIVKLTKLNDRIENNNKSIFNEAAKALDYEKYWSPQSKAARRSRSIIAPLYKNESSGTLKKRILKELASLDSLMGPNDYDYWNTRLSDAQYFGENYISLLKRIPYKYLLRDDQVIDKMANEYEEGETKNLKEGFHLLFTKFKLLTEYPRNYKLVADFVHNKIGSQVYKSNSQLELINTQKLLTDIEHLNIKKLNDLFLYLKLYTQLKLNPEKDITEKIIKNNNVSKLDRFGRYRLLIYDDLLLRKLPDSVSQKYLEYTIDLLKYSLSHVDDDQILSAYASFDKITLRKYLSDAYYRMSNKMMENAKTYLNLAVTYLPSQKDNLANNGFLTKEYEFLPEIHYDQIYIRKFENQKNDGSDYISRLADMVIIDPDQYKEFKARFVTTNPNADFKSEFDKILLSKLPKASELNLEKLKLNGESPTVGKYMFVDFWGTWCGACIDEMHEIDKLFTKNTGSTNLVITTVACFDNEKNVRDYMKMNKYLFPVLLSDGKIQKDFNISIYPTKILIFPNGTYVVLPFSSDYRSLIDKYLAWEL